MHAQAAQGLGQIRVGAGLVHRFVQLGGQGVVGGGVRAAGQLRVGVGEAVRQLREDGGVAVLRRTPGGQHLQDRAQVEELVCLRQRDLRDHDASTAGGLGQAVRHEPAQGLTQRRAGQPQSL